MHSIKTMYSAVFCTCLILTALSFLNYSQVVHNKNSVTNGTKIFDSNVTRIFQRNMERIFHPTNCALIFFGLPKSFKKIVLPSITKYVLAVNPHCDIFIHTYNISVYSNPRNHEEESVIIPAEMQSIGNITNMVFENLVDFHSRINVSYYHKYFPQGNGWLFPNSLDNMMLQWNSIQVGWNLMVDHEGKTKKKYERVGFFRPDVLYTNNIDIQHGQAVTAKFNNRQGWTNDRLFFGLREYAQIWATKRFSFVETYMNTTFGKEHGLHSEMFLNKFMIFWNIPLTLQNFCFYRVRATAQIILNDCKN